MNNVNSKEQALKVILGLLYDFNLSLGDVAVQQMKASSLAQRVAVNEGLELKVYTCPVGKLTIGYGRNVEDNGISEGEAAVLLMGDLEKLEVAVLKTYPWVSKLSPARRGVIVEMAFNLGMGGLAKFKKFLVAAQRGDYAEASVEMLDSTWARQVKKRATRLSEIMKTGKE